MPGDTFTIIMVVGLVESISCIFSGIIANYLGSKVTLLISFLFAGIGALLFVLTPVENTGLILVFLLLARAGISSSYNLCYIAMVDYFPSEY